MLAVRRAQYLGSFPVEAGEPAARVQAVSSQLHLMKESGCAAPVVVVVALSGVKICDPDEQSVRMCHALRRISYATCESARALFAFVAREPHREPPALPALPAPPERRGEPAQYCHAFQTDTPEQAEELNSLVGDAFRMAFASQLQPSAPLWGSELSGGERGAGGPLSGLAHRYHHSVDRSPGSCEIMGASKLLTSTSPSSSEESASEPEPAPARYRRLGERAGGAGAAGGTTGGRRRARVLLPADDDDSTPLMPETPTTPTTLPLCLNGYINEASEVEARTRASNHECGPAQLSAPFAAPLAAPLSAPHTLAHNDNAPLIERDDFKHCITLNNGSPSVSSGGSSCGASRGSGNNNAPRWEPELRHAAWFQAGIPREIALEVLGAEPVGAFLVRGSTTQAGCLALSVRVPRDFQPAGIAHYLILRTPKGYKIKGFTKEFTSLSALVTHHSVMAELLPVPLRLRRPPGPRVPPPTPRLADLDALAPPPPTAPHATPHTTSHTAPHAALRRRNL